MMGANPAPFLLFITCTLTQLFRVIKKILMLYEIQIQLFIFLFLTSYSYYLFINCVDNAEHAHVFSGAKSR